MKCAHSRCQGFNAKFNLLRTTKEFFKPLLSESPQNYKDELEQMFEKLKDLQIDAKEVKRVLTEINNRDMKEEVS